MANNPIKPKFDSGDSPSKEDIQDLIGGSTEHVFGRDKTGAVAANLDVGTPQFPLGELHARTVVVGGIEIDVNNIGGGSQIASSRLQKAAYSFYYRHDELANAPAVTLEHLLLPEPSSNSSYISIELMQSISLHEIHSVPVDVFNSHRSYRGRYARIWRGSPNNNNYINYMPVRAYIPAQRITITVDRGIAYIQRIKRMASGKYAIWLLMINDTTITNTATGAILARISTGNNSTYINGTQSYNTISSFKPIELNAMPAGIRDDSLILTGPEVYYRYPNIDPRDILTDGTNPQIYKINLNNFYEIGNPLGGMKDNYNDFNVDSNNVYSHGGFLGVAGAPNIFVTEV